MIDRLGPVDEYSGLPLPIVPIDAPKELLTVQEQEEYCRDDLHHAFFRNASLVTEGERVIRHARVQFGPRWSHSMYHRFFDAVPLPRSVDQQFALGIFATAGYIPETAVDVSGKRPLIVRLDSNMRRKMQEHTIYSEARYSSTTGKDLHQVNRGLFFMNYALDQGFDHVRQTILEEFIETKDAEQRYKLGMFIVDMAFKRAVEPIETTYRNAYSRELIHRAKPRHPVGFLRTIVDGHQPDYFPFIADLIEAPVAA